MSVNNTHNTPIQKERFLDWLAIFLKHVRERTIELHVGEDEGYKFASVQNFQSHFDIEQKDLAGNLEQALLSNNLVVGAMYFPRKMLLVYARMYTEETREALRNLFDESKPVAARLDETQKVFSELEERRSKETGQPEANTYIGLRFMSLLLAYRYPNEYNPLKPAEWKVFARFVNPDFSMPQRTSPGRQYEIYGHYIEPLREFLRQRQEITEIRDRLVEGLAFRDEACRWITQDVIYVTARAYADERAKEIAPEEPDREPFSGGAMSTQTETGEEATGFMAYESHLEEYVVKNWSNINFGESLSMYFDEDGTTGQQYTTDVGIIDILAKDEKGGFVVIELKRAESGYKVVGQVLNYMGWVEEKLAVNGEKVRGMVVVGRADKTLRAAVRPVSEKVTLKEYRLKMYLEDVKIL